MDYEMEKEHHRRSRSSKLRQTRKYPKSRYYFFPKPDRDRAGRNKVKVHRWYGVGPPSVSNRMCEMAWNQYQVRDWTLRGETISKEHWDDDDETLDVSSSSQEQTHLAPNDRKDTHLKDLDVDSQFSRDSVDTSCDDADWMLLTDQFPPAPIIMHVERLSSFDLDVDEWPALGPCEERSVDETWTTTGTGSSSSSSLDYNNWTHLSWKI